MGQHRASTSSRIDGRRFSCLKIDQGSCLFISLHRWFVYENLRRSPTSRGCKIIRSITSQGANRCGGSIPPRKRSCHKLRMAHFLSFTAATMSPCHIISLISKVLTHHPNPSFDAKIKKDSLNCRSGRTEHRSLIFPLRLVLSEHHASDFLWSCVDLILRFSISRGREKAIFELSDLLPDFSGHKRLHSLPSFFITATPAQH